MSGGPNGSEIRISSKRADVDRAAVHAFLSEQAHLVARH
jgi:hypothetical protein